MVERYRDSSSSDEDNITQVHSTGPNEHCRYDHWRVVPSYGGFATERCYCEDQHPIIYLSYKELRNLYRKDSSGNWKWFSRKKGSNNWTCDGNKIRRVADIKDY